MSKLQTLYECHHGSVGTAADDLLTSPLQGRKKETFVAIY